MFEQFHKDVISLINKYNEVYAKEIKAQVSPKKITILNGELSIETGDIIERILPSGKVERYRILDPVYHAEFYGIPERFECSVEKENTISRGASQSVTFNLNGHNSRIYTNSNDYSVNNVNSSAESVFKELREFIKENIGNHQELLRSVDKLEEKKGSREFVDAYQEFVSLAANHIAILSPFIPTLTGFLTS